MRSGWETGVLSPADQFSRQVKSLLNQQPLVHHMLDHASAPGSHRYFIEKTRPAVKYWGIDRNIKRQECNFIRDGSFMNIVADDDFKFRMKNIGKGITYDNPPIVLFDQKATLVLPFCALTRKYFSDEIRKILAYSTPLLSEEIVLSDGSTMTPDRITPKGTKKLARKIIVRFSLCIGLTIITIPHHSCPQSL